MARTLWGEVVDKLRSSCAAPTSPDRCERDLKGACYFSLAYFILILGVILLRNWSNLLTSCERLTDYVLLSLNVENAKDLMAWTGAYSRLELRHPGPVLFYLYAVGDWLFPFIPMPLGRFRLIQFFINGFFLLVAVLAAIKLTRSWMMGIIAGTGALLLSVNSSGSAFGILAEVWNPFPAILPAAALILAGGLVMTGQSAWLPVATAAAVVAAHTHLGALPVIGALYLVIISKWAVVIYKGQGAPWKLSAVLAAAIGMITSIPMIVEAWVSPYGGNLGAILRFASDATSAQPLSAVLQAIGRHYTKLFECNRSWVSILTPMALLVLLWIPSRPSPEVGATRTLATLGYLLSVYSVLRTSGPLYQYLFIYHFGIALVVWMLAIYRAAQWLEITLPLGMRWRRGLSVVVSIILMALLLPQLTRKTPVIDNCPTLGAARLFARGIPRVHNELNHLVTADERLWHSLAALALVLKRAGREVCVDRLLWYVFDSSLVCAHQENAAPRGSPRVRTITMFNLNLHAVPDGAKSVTLKNLGIFWMPIRQPQGAGGGQKPSNEPG
jgi:hypothetical protein